MSKRMVVDYEPYIDAVFSASQHKPYIPWNINDIPVADIAPIFDVFLSIFDLSESRFKQSEILKFIDLKEVQQRFNLTFDEVVLIIGFQRKRRYFHPRANFNVSRPEFEKYAVCRF